MLRPPVAFAVAAAVFVAAAAFHARAALDSGEPASAPQRELLVFEVKDCTICSLVHQHIEPAYRASSNARRAPMRFVDLNEIDERAVGLASPITMVPTTVLMEQGVEVARLPGYTGPQIFFQAMHRMLPAED